MIANYGYKDGSGLWLITIDSDQCDGCGECAAACPYDILEIVNNEYDPLAEGSIPAVKEQYRKKIKYSCAPCKPVGEMSGEVAEPCIKACPREAISHSW